MPWRYPGSAVPREALGERLQRAEAAQPAPRAVFQRGLPSLTPVHGQMAEPASAFRVCLDRLRSVATACTGAYHVGMSRGNATGRQYTIRNVPAAVDKALRRTAAKSRRSLNDVALEALAKAAQVNAPERRDLEAFFGSWVEDPEVDRALRAQREVDEALWR